MAKLSKDEILTAVEEMTVLELSDLVKALEEKFGVSASPVAMAAAPASAESSGEAKEEQTVFNVVLTEAGAKRLLTAAVRYMQGPLSKSLNAALDSDLITIRDELLGTLGQLSYLFTLH